MRDHEPARLLRVDPDCAPSSQPKETLPWNDSKPADFPPEVLKLFDGYVHGWLSRRDFLDKAGKYAVGGFSAAAMLESLRPNYAFAQQVAKNDPRIATEYLTYPRAGLGHDEGLLRAARRARANGPASS